MGPPHRLIFRHRSKRFPQGFMLEKFIEQLNTTPESIQFPETIALIDSLYEFQPTAFRNGEVRNGAGQNSGSCKIFAFASLQKLSVPQTLACFGSFYRDDVLKHPDADNHQNIRNFMRTGWDGIEFQGEALRPRG
jgi:hypothetical protein